MWKGDYNMYEQSPHIIPSLYLSNYINEFEEIILKYDVNKKNFIKGEYLTNYGVINNTAYFIKSGIIHLALGHEQGKKSLSLFGPGTIFPMGVETHDYKIEYEMIIQAFSNVEAYSMTYPTLRKMAEENGKLAGQLLKENCDFIGYMFFDSINQTFEPCLRRICDILYLYITKVEPKESKVPFTQAELASIAGASQSQMERSLKILKKEGIIETSRGQIKILNLYKLLAHCTLGVHEDI